MNDRTNPAVARRDLLRVLAFGSAATAAGTGVSVIPAASDSESNSEKRKARYQPNSPKVQTFYRVKRRTSWSGHTVGSSRNFRVVRQQVAQTSDFAYFNWSSQVSAINGPDVWSR